MDTKIMQREMTILRATLERTLTNISVQHFYGAAQRERVMETTRIDIRCAMLLIQKWQSDLVPDVPAVDHTRRHIDAIANYRAPVTPTADRPVNPEPAWEPPEPPHEWETDGWNDHPDTH